ncbi:MAG: sigma-70 family RNA polymerase sigma factor [Rikenellaceae bacterium]
MIKEMLDDNDLQIVLDAFNKKEYCAFEQVYNLLYKDLYYYASSLYKDTVVDYRDVIQDVFLDVWRDKTRKFDSILGLKTFLFVVIRNKFRMYYKHMKVVERANNIIAEDQDLFIVQAAEAEIFSIIPTALNMLPSECAKVMKLFLEGHNVDEIAEMLNKQPSTIYRQRSDALAILRNKLPKNQYLSFIYYCIQIGI